MRHIPCALATRLARLEAQNVRTAPQAILSCVCTKGRRETPRSRPQAIAQRRCLEGWSSFCGAACPALRNTRRHSSRAAYEGEQIGASSGAPSGPA